MTTIYLLRHCALAEDYRGRYVGQIDPPLSPEGVCQAYALAEALSGQGLDGVYCSDLARSRQTAEILAARAGVECKARPELREIALGEWDGLERREVATRFAAQYAARGADLAHYRIPGGESHAECLARILLAWREIAHPAGRTLAIVGHAGANRLLLCHLRGIPLTRMFDIAQAYGCVNVIEVAAEGAVVRQINGRGDALSQNGAASAARPGVS